MFGARSHSTARQHVRQTPRRVGHAVRLAVVAILLFSSSPAAAQSTAPAISGALLSGTTVVVAGKNLHGVVTLTLGDETASNVAVSEDGALVTGTMPGAFVPGTYALTRPHSTHALNRPASRPDRPATGCACRAAAGCRQITRWPV